MHGPVVIAASVPGSGDGSSGGNVAFNPLTQNQRPGLALVGGTVWVGWASHGDNGPYHGWVIGFNGANLTQSKGVFNTTPNGGQGGIWMSGGGISADALGNLYVSTGNGTFDENGKGVPLDMGDTVLKLTPSNGSLGLSSSFTPYDQANLNAVDADLGVTACTLFDNPGGPQPHLLVTSGKAGTIYLLNRDSLGGYASTGTINHDIQDFSNGGFSVRQGFALFNNHLYMAPDGGPLSVWTFSPAQGLFNRTPATAANSSFGCNGCDGAGATPTVSANGTANPIVWVLDNSAYNSGPAGLHAFDQTLATELYSSAAAANNRDQAGVAVKFTTPTVANGFVYVGGFSAVTVYGLFKNAPPTAAAPTIAPGPGPYSAPVSVTLASATAGAVIHYTLDGSTPTAASPVYTKAIPISSTTVLSAFAAATGMAQSAVVSGMYLFGTPGNVFSIENGFTATNLTLNGSSTINAKRLRLTDGGAAEAASAWWNTPVHLTNFATWFDFQMSAAQADGMTFTLQNQGKTALGASGGGLGYGPDTPGGVTGITPSAAIKFDLYDNAGEGPDSTGLYTDGASPTVPALNLSGSAVDLHNGHIFAVAMRYDGVSLVQIITDTVTHHAWGHTYTVNLPKVLGGTTALPGFTAGTGGLATTAEVLNWSYSVPPVEQFPASGLAATVSAGAPALVALANAAFPAGKGVRFPATTAGQKVTFTLTAATRQTFAVTVLADTAANRGQVQLAIDGKNLGAAIEGYAAKAGVHTVSLGSVYLAAGKHTFAFTVTGKNKAAMGYQSGFGQITLTP